MKVKRKILSTLLNGMLTHKEDPTMMRNGCLTLCQFQIPADVLFDYERLVRTAKIVKGSKKSGKVGPHWSSSLQVEYVCKISGQYGIQ